MNEISDEKYPVMSDKSLMEMIGNFIKHHRLNQNKSQDQISNAAGISRSTLSLLERGQKVKLDSLIQVLRVLDLLHIMDSFKVEEQISPLEYSRLKKKQRKQASPKKSTNSDNQDLGW